MNIEAYDYDLPERLIAQTPLENRTSSKLLVLHPEGNDVTHDKFKNITQYLQKGDCLVLNNSKVIPVRLFGVKVETKAKIEILLLHEKTNDERSEEHMSELQ